MTTYSADTFTRADGPVGNAPIGGAWTASGAATRWAIASHKLTGKSDNGYAGLLTVDDGQFDGAVQATLVAGASAGIVFRYTSAKDYWVLSLGVQQYIKLSYCNPASGYVSKANPGAAAAAGDVFRIELTGPAIVVYRNGRQIISISDPARASATSHGLLTAGSGLTTFDGFTHTSLSGTATPPPSPTPAPVVHRFFNVGGHAVAVT